MRPRLPAALAGLVVLAAPAALSAQSLWLSPSPPPAIRIVRETSKFGTAAKHMANERAWVAALQSKNVPFSYVGTVAATGAPEFWFIGGAQDFAAFEELDQIYQNDKSLGQRLDTLLARESAFVTDVRTMLATYRADLSHAAAFVLPETRHFWVSTFSVHPGQDAAFAAMMAAYVAAYRAAGITTPWVTYEVVAGATTPTFLLLVPLNSYGDLDQDLAQRATVGAKLTSPEAVAAQFAASTARVETQVLTISPQISYVPEAFANQDKAFWKVK